MKNRVMFFAMASCLTIALNSEVANAAVTCVGREASLSLQIEDSRLISVSIDGGLQYVDQSPTPVMELPDQTLVYEFIVDDSYDTNTYYSFGILNGEVQGRQIYQNGNDSDTYEGWLVANGDKAFVCH
jgi:hypothetical protein